MKARFGLPTISLLAFLLCGFAAKAQLQADFTALAPTGCAPLIVHFTDKSTGNPTNWKWDLGNGTISFLQNPSASYFNAGQYTVKLIVSNGTHSDTLVETQFVTVAARPEVAFSASSTSGCFPLPVDFKDESKAGSGTISAWQWDFGDGLSSTEQNPKHVYAAAGNFNVTLRVFNNNGCFTTYSRSQYIQITAGVKAGFSNSVPKVCSPPVLINFQNLSTGTGALSYEWQFGDGATSSDKSPVHSYTATGTFTTQLIVTNSIGCRDTISKPGAVTVGNVYPSFNVAESICANVPLSFQNTSTPTPLNALWSFGDGTSSTQLNFVKRFSSPGTYTVKMIAGFGSCQDSASKTITVLQTPKARFSADDSTNCAAPFTVNFLNQSSGAASYEWDFQSGVSSILTNPTQTYILAGDHPVKLIATGANGCSDTLQKPAYIKISPPTASVQNTPDSGCAPFFKSFSAAITSVDSVVGYEWHFGDGTVAHSSKPTHIYSTPGVYTVKLVLTTASGCADTTVLENAIFVNSRPEAKFSASPRDACARMDIAFTDESSGVPVKWRWDFGDGSFSTARNPVHAYNDTGYFDVRLVVWNSGCSDTVIYQEYMHIKPPIARFAITSNCATPLQRQFTDQSIGADEWAWDFGDGNTSNERNPIHTYRVPGDYRVTLVVLNHQTGCDYSSKKMVQVVDVDPDFTSTENLLCKGAQAKFTTNLSLTEISNFRWDFGDGTIVDSIMNSASHTYKTAGIFNVQLVTTNVLGCKDTVMKSQSITVNGPTAKFAPSVPGTCLNNTVFFNDSSQTDGTHQIVSWTWNYADGNLENSAAGNSQHTYASPGIYKVGLTVTDNAGCVDSIKLETALIISKPLAKFSADTLGCPGKPVQFINQSTGPRLQYAWAFGDGTSSTAQSPMHTYLDEGKYSVKLVITDQYGCMDSILKSDYLQITATVANFSMSDSFSTCPPLIVQFTNLSENAVSQTWDFGDGSSAAIADPSHFYSYPGIYTITLTIKGKGGCTEIRKKNIQINGPTGTFSYNPLAGCNPVTVNFSAKTKDRTSFIWDFNNGVTSVTTDSILSYTYKNQGSYVPKMILVDPNGCQVPISGRDTILVSGIIAGIKFPGMVLCDAGNVSFGDSSISNDLVTNYRWDFGDGTTSTLRNPDHNYATTGLYYPRLTVTTKNGCVDSVKSTRPVKIVASPQATLSKTGNGCTPLAVTFKGALSAPDSSAVTWSWNFGNGQTATLQNPAAQLFKQSGNYDVLLTVANSSGCIDTVNEKVVAHLIPLVNAGPDTVICKNIGVTLQVTGAQEYKWNTAPGLSCTNCASPVATPDSVTQYIVKGTSGEGCSANDTVIVKVKYPFKIAVSKADTLCKGQNLKLFAIGADRYEWSPSMGLSNDVISNPNAKPDTTITYRVIGTDYKGCFRDTGFVPVKVYPIPTVYAGADQTINIGQTTDLIPTVSTDVTEVTWSPTGAIFRNNYPAISVKPNSNTEYTVEVKNRGGCMTRDRVSVFVICNGTNVFIPNTFSPNNDGANDVFYPRGTGLFKVKSMRIFNRWGELIFERSGTNANDQAAGWDGTFKGVKLPADVFVYMIDIICDNNSILPLKGNVALIN
ncbi:MAG: PKD domain-containing protein [Bacteroidota bacterium]